jgi:hypothetical protein
MYYQLINSMNRASATPSIVTSGLVLNLDAGNPLSYPGSGTTWTDLSGNGNNGTLINGTGYNSANGGVLTFDGINDYVNTTLVTNQAAFTYCIWGKSSALGYQNRIMGNADVNGTNGASIMWGTPAITGQAEDYNRLWCIRRNANNMTNDIITPTIPGFTNNWHYIVMTFNTTDGLKIYSDNVLIASNPTTVFTSVLTLKIGRDGNGTDAFLGSIGATHVYNKALNTTEIATNFNATKTRFGL